MWFIISFFVLAFSCIGIGLFYLMYRIYRDSEDRIKAIKDREEQGREAVKLRRFVYAMEESYYRLTRMKIDDSKNATKKYLDEQVKELDELERRLTKLIISENLSSMEDYNRWMRDFESFSMRTKRKKTIR